MMTNDPALGRRLRSRAILSLMVLFGLAFVAGIEVHRLGMRHGVALAQEPGIQGPDIDLLAQENKAFERIAETVTPAVVNIQTTHVVRLQESPFFNDPFFRQFFGPMQGIPREQREHALGSGVIVSPDGYIVTNNHVIAKATEIQVMMSNLKVYKGKVVGADPETDVAVVKIEGDHLPTAAWGESADLKPGDTVLAFGNPFGLNFTMTKGIVSAVGRSGLGIENYEDFIQTDAAINPGNSGGALVDVHGRVVGLNTAIVSGPSATGQGAFNGVGLAIPSDVVRHIMESLIKSGKVVRGFLGVTVGDLNEQLARQFKVPDLSGALVDDVSPGSPADKAGLKAGDVIRSLNGQKVASKDALTNTVAGIDPGTRISIELLRNGSPMKVEAVLAERPKNATMGPGSAQAPAEGTLQGVSVEQLTSQIRKQLGIPEGVSGVVVSQLDPSSPAAQQGLQQGDVIESVNHQPVANPEDFSRMAADLNGDVLLRIIRNGAGLFVVISPQAGDNGGGNGGDNGGE